MRGNKWGKLKADQEAPARYALYQQRIHYIHSIIQYTRRKGGNTLSTTRLLYVLALKTSVVSNPSLFPLFIGSFRKNKVVKVIASIIEGSQESLRALFSSL